MRSRRSFLRLTGGAAGAPFATARYGIDEVAALTEQAAAGGRTPAQVAADEDYWREIQFAFTLDRTHHQPEQRQLVPAPHGRPRGVQALQDWANQAPIYHRGMTERNIETTRRRLAAEFGADPEEIAITRNSSESLQIAQIGHRPEAGRRGADDRAGLRPHAHHVGPAGAPRQDQADAHRLPRADHTARTCSDASRSAITPQTKVMHFCHITNQSGQLFPVRQLSRPGPLARHHHRSSTAPTRWATSPSSCATSAMDYYGVSACTSGCWRRWAPGCSTCGATRIASTWPLQAAPAHARHGHPQVRGDRHPRRAAPRRPSTRRLRSSRPSASNARPPGCAI